MMKKTASEKMMDDFLSSIHTKPKKIAPPEEDLDESVDIILDEAKKRLTGNSCVNTGKGSGGGFVACSVSSGPAHQVQKLVKGKIEVHGNYKTAEKAKEVMADLKSKGEKVRVKEVVLQKSVEPKAMARSSAVKVVSENVPPSVLRGWFKNADKNYKDKLVNAIKADDGKVHNAGLNIFHQVYQDFSGKKMSFEEFLDTPMTLYRGGSSPKDEPFTSFTPDKAVAKNFLRQKASGELQTIQIKPRDTLGMYQTIAEAEVLIPTGALK